MRKSIILITLLWGIATGLLTSCYDDKGNYDYIMLNEVEIDTAGCNMVEALSIQRYDHITIEPNIYYNGERVNDNENVPLDYMWTLYSQSTVAGSYEYVNDTLGYSPRLDTDVTTLAGTYLLQLTVTQRETGVEEYFIMPCLVEESITAGWMLLYERANQPGTSDVGLVVNSLVKKNITAAQEREFWDLYSASNQEPLQGTPVRIIRPIASLASGTDPVICLTSTDLVGINNTTFQKVTNFEDFFYTAPDVKAPTWYGPASRGMLRHFLINDNKIHTVDYSSATTGGNYMGDAKSADYGELAPWGSDISNTNYAVVYDQTNGCFYHIVQFTTDVTPFEPQSPTAAFDVNNVGATLLASDWGRGTGSPMDGYDYFLMGNGSNRYLAIANFSATATDTNVGIGWYDITASPGITEATSIAAACNGEYVLYGSGNKVYNLLYNTSDIAQEAWVAPSTDEEVTCVRISKYYYAVFMLTGIMPNSNTVVHIATWNETTKEGKLYQYTINQATGEITGEPRIYTVPGKVGDMSWKYVME